MAAYVISEVEVLDPEQYAAYREVAAPAVAAYGGRYLARGGAVETIEDQFDGDARRFVVLQFDSLERAHEWYDSPEYAKAREIQPKATRRRLTFLEGVAETA